MMKKKASSVSVRRSGIQRIAALQLLLLLGSAPVFASALIPQVGWTLQSVDSDETIDTDGAATNAFDGDVSTFWHTQLQGSNLRPSHNIDIDPGAVHDLNGFRYLPRQDGGVDGRVEIYTFYVSMDGVSWGSPVAAGTFRNNAQDQEVTFALIQDRFVRFRVLTEENGQPWTSVAERNLLGTASSREPNGVIDTPGDGATRVVGDALNFNGSGSDPDSSALLSYRWNFGDSTLANLTTEDPTDVVFNMPGTHTVTLTVVGHLGLADSTPATIATSETGSSAPIDFRVPISEPTGPLIESALIVINGESDVILSGLRISNPDGACIQIKNGASNIVVENSEIGPCGKHGINIENSSHARINNNYIHDAVNDALRSWKSHDIAVVSNRI